MANSGTTARMPHPTVVSPLATLHQQAIKLEAAMVVCRATPKKEPVHTLRRATRSVEAQLALLELLPHLPRHSSEADKVRKRIKAVRKAAGIVRDCDVQRKLVLEDFEDFEDVGDAGKQSAKAETPSGKTDAPESAAGAAGHGDRMLRDAKTLAKHLKLLREDETAKLTELLRTEEKRVAKALRKLEAALEPAEQRTIPATRLAANIEHWFQARSPRPAQRSNGGQAGNRQAAGKMDEDALHALRKAAKLCRYMAESLPADLPETERLTSRFETIQESGGKWHDWLLLQQIAAKQQGERAALTERYAQHRDAALADYQAQLTQLLPAGPSHAATRPLPTAA